MSNNKRLTAKQEMFAQAIVDGHTQSEAYKLAYDTSNMLPATVHNSANKLMCHGEIAARIAKAREAVATGLVAQRVLTAESLIVEAETNLRGAREDHAWAPANKAVEIMARLSGNLEVPERAADVKITTIEINLSTKEGQVIDVEEYQVRDGDFSPGTQVDADRYTILPNEGEGADTEA